MAKDKELADHERAHNGKPGSDVRHGADAIGNIPRRKMPVGELYGTQDTVTNSLRRK